MRENANHNQGQLHCGDQHHPIDHAGSDKLSRPCAAAKKIYPADDRNRHAYHADKRFLVSNEGCIPKNCLRRPVPNNQQGSIRQLDNAVHRRVL
jgi:hypothetical protein